MMSFLSALKDKVAKKFLGELVADLGTVAIAEIHREVSLAVRRQAGQPPYIEVKVVWTATGQTNYFPIACSQEWADSFEKVAREMRRQS
jgi:hypothetical protein